MPDLAGASHGLERRRPHAVGDAGHRPQRTSSSTRYRADLEAHRRVPRPAGAAARPPRQPAHPQHQRRAAVRRRAASSAATGASRATSPTRCSAQRAVVASETRYHELFERSPSPLVLHRDGVVFDANPAAARLFGFRDAGDDDRQAWSPTCIAARRPRASARVERMRAARAAWRSAKACRWSTSRRGRSTAAASACRPPRCASTPTAARRRCRSSFDDHRAPARSRRRCAAREAMLSHLFATSPDCITLTEIASGRYAMVNAGLQRAHRLRRRRGRSAAPPPSSACGTTAATANGCATACSTRRQRGRPAGCTITQPQRRARLDAGLGRALHDGPARLPGDQRARRDRRPSARGSSTRRSSSARRSASPSRATAASCWPTRASSGCSAGRSATLSGQPGAAVWPTATTTPRSATLAGPLLARGEQFEIERADEAARRQHLLVPAAGAGRRPLAPEPRRHDLDRRGRDRAAPPRRRRWPRRATRPRRRAAPRAPSSPTPATRSARR